MDENKIYGYFRKLKEKFKDEEIYDKDFLDVAVRIYNSEMISMEKAGKMAQSGGKREFKLKNPTAPATDKSKAYLLGLGYEGNVEGLNQGEVSQLIDEYKEKQKKSAGYEY